jgi:hypothetical protein
MHSHRRPGRSPDPTSKRLNRLRSLGLSARQSLRRRDKRGSFRFIYELQQPQLAGETVEQGLYIGNLRSLKKWRWRPADDKRLRQMPEHFAQGLPRDGVIWTISFVNGVNSKRRTRLNLPHRSQQRLEKMAWCQT